MRFSFIFVACLLHAIPINANKFRDDRTIKRKKEKEKIIHRRKDADLIGINPVNTGHECINDVFNRWSKNYPSMTLCVWSGSSHPIYKNKSYKTFEAMSITKAFVATVINQLVDEGKINLYSSFQNYLPSDIDVRNWCDTGNAHDVRVRDLLQHESGFQDIWNTAPKTDFEKAWEAGGPDKFWSARDTLAYMPSLMNSCGRNRQWSYADTNYIILGLIVEHVTGNTLAREIRTRILNELGMSNTFMLHFEYPDGTPAKSKCEVTSENRLGDGYCDINGGYNTPECGFDGGDCCDYSCKDAQYKCSQYETSATMHEVRCHFCTCWHAYSS